MNLIQLENRVGRPIQAGEFKIIPIEQSLQFQPPGMRFFSFWRKPSSVIVQHPDGSDELLEIQDPTRQAQITLWGLALLIPFIIWLVKRAKR
ncbi:MAG TPA: hypothetical protein DEH25_16865 [Chloroflexi bacterium]|nr:hypothetical protein [Chloroflexota bacterium]